MINTILEYITIFLALIVVLPVHEFAHAFVAVKCGDYTPKTYGRYTLNPMAHFDLLGLICFVLARFGWAKPVPVNPMNFRKYRLHSFFVAGAGVLANYILAFIAYPLFILSFQYVPEFGLFTQVLTQTLLYIFSFSLSFAIFNLLPIYPLDGFRLIDSFLKKKTSFYYNYKKYGIYVLYALFFLSIISDFTNLYYLDVLGNIIGLGVGVISTPITWFWGLIF